MKNARPSKPVRRRRTVMGPTPFSLMARAVIKIRGDSRTSAVPASAISLARFATLSVRVSGARCIPTETTGSNEGKLLCPKTDRMISFPGKLIDVRTLPVGFLQRCGVSHMAARDVRYDVAALTIRAGGQKVSTKLGTAERPATKPLRLNNFKSSRGFAGVAVEV
jgi:hypothetical protein